MREHQAGGSASNDAHLGSEDFLFIRHAGFPPFRWTLESHFYEISVRLLRLQSRLAKTAMPLFNPGMTFGPNRRMPQASE
jgi:hypothetical protein